MSNLLALDTSTDACSVAINQGDHIHYEFAIAPRRHSEILLQMVETLLKETKLTLQDLDAIAFGCGPGSFMGVRLATGVAQGLAFGANIPVIPVSTLQTLAQGTDVEGPVLAGWDARMNEIYWGIYETDQDGVMQPLQQDALSAPADIKIEQPCFAVGNAWREYERQLTDQLKNMMQFEAELSRPHASMLLKIAKAKLLRGETVPAEQAEPTYLRNDVARKPLR